MKHDWPIVIMIVMAVAPGAMAATDQNSSMYLRGEQEFQQKIMRAKTNQAAEMTGLATEETGNVTQAYTPIIEASWTAVEEPSPKGFRVHDLITIQVNEVSSHSSKADSKTERDGKVDFKLTDWIKLTGGDLRPAPQRSGDLAIGGSATRDFEGKGDVSRKDSLMARIQAEVVDVYPNGNLCLEARHTVITDDETTIITLTGICRSKDVSVANTIISSQIADLRIQKQHEGMARDATKRSWIHSFLDWLNPF